MALSNVNMLIKYKKSSQLNKSELFRVNWWKMIQEVFYCLPNMISPIFISEL